MLIAFILFYFLHNLTMSLLFTTQLIPFFICITSTLKSLKQTRAHNIYQQIKREAMDEEQVKRAERFILRAGMPFVPPESSRSSSATSKPKIDLGNSIMDTRKDFAKTRQEWEASFQKQSSGNPSINGSDGKNIGGPGMARGVKEGIQNVARSALTSRMSSASEKVESFMGGLNAIESLSRFSSDKTLFEESLKSDAMLEQTNDEWNQMLALLQKYYRDNGHCNVPLNFAAYPKLGRWVQVQREAYKMKLNGRPNPLTQKRMDALDALGFSWDDVTESSNDEINEETRIAQATSKASEMVAKAGAGDAFTGDNLGIGGLDDVLSQVKRRVWVPLAAPPSLLKELGINPVRGLLLYGMPGEKSAKSTFDVLVRTSEKLPCIRLLLRRFCHYLNVRLWENTIGQETW